MSPKGSFPSKIIPRPVVALTGIIMGEVISVCKPALLIARMIRRYSVLLTSEGDLKMHHI